MTADGILVLRALFSLIWQLFTSWYIPGTHTTPAAFAIFMLVFGLIMRSVRGIFGSVGGTLHDDSIGFEGHNDMRNFKKR